MAMVVVCFPSKEYILKTFGGQLYVIPLGTICGAAQFAGNHPWYERKTIYGWLIWPG